MEKIIEWRRRLRDRAIELAKLIAGEVNGTVLLVGSYARGDFNVDSDVDVLVVAEFTEPPHRRLLNINMPPNVEVIALNIHEAINAVGKCYPIAHDIALGVVLKDDLGIARELIEHARRCIRLSNP
ncbi:nucleotidyltransferase domain-containing protein [Caldivirga sp.]|uniref:nucleotidyltransferase domain-containing protein n=1 Tax=Caldivirga sp. TaxID=2080243 RepID=UPI003D0CAB66